MNMTIIIKSLKDLPLHPACLLTSICNPGLADARGGHLSQARVAEQHPPGPVVRGLVH